MPGIGGLETCREIRASSEVAIIMPTVHDAEKDKVSALDAGADGTTSRSRSAHQSCSRGFAPRFAGSPHRRRVDLIRFTWINIEINFATRRGNRRRAGDPVNTQAI